MHKMERWEWMGENLNLHGDENDLSFTLDRPFAVYPLRPFTLLSLTYFYIAKIITTSISDPY